MKLIMKTFNYLFLLLFTVFALAGCKNVLEEEVYDFYSPSNLYKTQADAEAAVTGLYGHLHSWDFFKAPYLFGEDTDHDHIVGPQWNMADMGAGNFNNYWGLPAIWRGSYFLISQSNTILSKVPAIVIEDDSVKNRIMGEAHFFRAWSYFNLVRLWGAVPLRLDVSSGASADLARSPVAKIYEQVVSDLTQAEKLLPSIKSKYTSGAGKVTQGAAKALLAKVYLTMASGALAGEKLTVRGETYTKSIVKGHEGMNSTELFTKARDKAREVIQSRHYELVPKFMDLWGRTHKNNKEMIWELQTQDNDAYGTLLQYFYSAPWYGGTSYYWMAQNLYDSYGSTDERATEGVFHQYYMYGAWMLYPERDSVKYKNAPGGGTAQFYKDYSHPFPRKYWIGTSSEVGETGVTVRGGNRDVNFPFLRFADVLLMYAEAENEVNGPVAAYEALNAVRARSKEQPVSTSLTREQFRSVVFEERGKEFYQECNRRADLIRWGVYLSVMNKLQTVENVVKTRQEKNLLFPIPQAELNANKLIEGNNFGW